MSEHTPTPWHLEERGRAPDGSFAIYGPVKTKDGYTMFPRIVSVAAMGGPDANYGARDEANARFICQAVNCHDDLVKALERMSTVTDIARVSLYDEEGVEGWRYSFADGSDETVIGFWDEPPPAPDFVTDALDKARAAVA